MVLWHVKGIRLPRSVQVSQEYLRCYQRDYTVANCMLLTYCDEKGLAPISICCSVWYWWKNGSCWWGASWRGSALCTFCRQFCTTHIHSNWGYKHKYFWSNVTKAIFYSNTIQSNQTNVSQNSLCCIWKEIKHL